MAFAISSFLSFVMDPESRAASYSCRASTWRNWGLSSKVPAVLLALGAMGACFESETVRSQSCLRIVLGV